MVYEKVNRVWLYIDVWCFARTKLIYFPIKNFILKE